VAFWKGNTGEEGSGGSDFTWSSHSQEVPQNKPEELEKTLTDRFGQIQSALSRGTKIEGKLSFDKPVRIDGELKGEVVAPTALVVVGADAKIDAQLEASVLVILGEVRGAVRALKRVELLAGGTVIGDIETSELVIEQGSSFNGSCKMPEPAPADQQSQNKAGETWLSKRDRKKKGKEEIQPQQTEGAAEKAASAEEGVPPTA